MASRGYGQPYNLFILVLTVVALAVMVLLWLPLSPETIALLRSYDTAVCVIFLADFAVALRRADSKRVYFFDERGWMDLLGSVPSVPALPVLGLLRLVRIHRLRAISRSLGHQNRAQMIGDLLRNRAQYAVLTTFLAAFLVTAAGSVVVLEAESQSPSANIRSGADAFWWAIVTLCTVGYGDRYPTTLVGRAAAIFVMVTGIGIIGSLASIMASFLVNPRADTRPVSEKLDTLAAELQASRQELTALRRVLLERNGELTMTTSDAPSVLAEHQQTPAPPPTHPRENR